MADAARVDGAARRAEDELGPIDVWVNVAFSSVFAPFWEIAPDEFERTTEVTYLGYANGTRAALKRMMPRDRGVIVQCGSALAYRGIPLQSAYCGAKHAVQGLHDSLRAELMHEGSGVKVTMVQMPAVNTPQFDWVLNRLPRAASARPAHLPAGDRGGRARPRRRAPGAAGVLDRRKHGRDDPRRPGRGRAAGPLSGPDGVLVPADGEARPRRPAGEPLGAGRRGRRFRRSRPVRRRGARAEPADVGGAAQVPGRRGDGRRRRGRRGGRGQAAAALTARRQDDDGQERAMAQQVADYVLGRLAEWGVDRVYGYPGDGINGMLGAFDRAGGKPEFIQARHEEMAAFMACGHAKFTGEAGVCVATSGPGAIHLLNGLYDAKLDHQPVVAIVGQQKRLAQGTHYQQEVNLENLFSDVSEYCQIVMHPGQMRHVIDRAFKTALTTRGVATIIVPEDVQEADAVPSPPKEHGSVYSSVGWSRPRVLPDRDELRKAADILNEGGKVAMLVGQGAADAEAEVIETAELLGAGVAKALLGRAVLPDDLPFVTGPIGLLGSKASDEMMMNCDTLFMIGTSFPYAEWLPDEGSCRGVEIDIDGRMIGIRYPMDAHVVGDAKETLRELIPLLRRKEDRSWREEIEENVRAWDAVLEKRAGQSFEGKINPQAVAHELSPLLPDGAILTADSGSATNWWARHIKLRDGMHASLSGTLATMGPGVPYAIAARFAFPDRPVICFVGDGAFQMNGMNEMITVKRYAERMAGSAPLVFAVFNNQDLNQVTWEQRAMGGDPKFAGSQSIPDFPYAEYAELAGLKGIYCDEPGKVTEAWREALASDRPVVLEFVVDSEIAPIPPHIMKDQAKKAVKAGMKDPQKIGIAARGFRQKLTDMYENMPGRRH
ncbi:thiamine pyrophosphate-requiring protein [Actinomadura madurae]|uniref:thiamine pyrophosphate-requiring protein n=1 Tax=Actinomadura madurae TaxID=1993 RepID=UPI0020D1FBCE|nr:thiamine pyrophosphate-requiring protein [Actinomadura madurae]